MIILGVDLGKARTGVAVCDKSEMLASPVEVVYEHGRARLLERVAAIAKARGAAARGRARRTPAPSAQSCTRCAACPSIFPTSAAQRLRRTIS